MAESEEELKRLLMKVKGEWKTWLKTRHSKNEDHGIQSHHCIQIDGGKVGTVSYFIFLGSKIAADGDCCHKIKRHLLLGRKPMTNLDSLLKSRDITLPTKVCRVKSMVFPIVIYGCEGWTLKKAECQRSDAFELWCWRRCLRVSWTARRSNQSILKEISPELNPELEGLMLKLKLQYFGYLMWRANSLEKTPMLGKAGEEAGNRGWDGWMVSPTQWTWAWANPGRWWRTGKPGVLQSVGSWRVRHDLVPEQQQSGSESPRSHHSAPPDLISFLKNWSRVDLVSDIEQSHSVIYTRFFSIIGYWFGGGLAAQLCQTLRDPMDCSPPGSSVHGISQDRILEWVAISFSNCRLLQDIEYSSVCYSVGPC